MMLPELIYSFLVVLVFAINSLIFALVDPFGSRTNATAREMKENIRPLTPIIIHCLTGNATSKKTPSSHSQLATLFHSKILISLSFSGVFIYLWIVRLSLYKSMVKNDKDEEINHDRTYVYTI